MKRLNAIVIEDGDDYGKNETNQSEEVKRE